MSINIKTLACNANCANCYENEIRKCHREKIDFDAIKETLSGVIADKASQPGLHGGEPLLLGKERCAELFEMILEARPTTGIQTNGLLIDDEWIDLFLKYKTNVGISLDGDTAELNGGRETNTAAIMSNVRKMRDVGISVSVISVLWKHNASAGRIQWFIRFLKLLADEFGIFYARTNPGIGFSGNGQLTNTELANALIAISEACLADRRLRWQPTRDVVEMMMGFGHATCTFRGCDVWATSAEKTILGDGAFGNCLKGGAARDGIVSLRADKQSDARMEALERIPMYQGGCKGCKFWDFCHGGCPGEALNDDYRNKTRFCDAYIVFFAYVKNKMEGLLPSVYVGTSQPLINLGADGTTWRIESMKAPVIVTPEESKKNCGTHGDSHGDRPHGDSNDPQWRAAHPEWGRR